jgi:rubrerythrin
MSTTRRQFLVRSAGATAAATVPSLLFAAPALASDETDVIVNLVGLEQASALMYTTIAENKALSAETKKLIDTFHGQEEEHVTAFTEALDQLHEDAPDTPDNVADIDELSGLDKATSEKELLGFAISLEEKLVAAWLAATADFETADIIRSGSQVAANHMQHLTVLRSLNGAPAGASIELPKPSEADTSPSSSSGDSSTTDSTSTDSSTDSSPSN